MDANVAKIKKGSSSQSLRDSALMNYGLKFIVGTVIILIFLTTVQCSFKKPEAPTWTTSLTIPMVNRTYEMSEIINKIDQPNLYVDSTFDSTGADGISYYSYTPVFAYSETLDTISVADNLTIDDIVHRAAETLGEITIYPDDPNPVVINLSDYVSLVLGAVPAVSFDLTDDLPDLGKFSQATISSGDFDIIFANDFGIDLDTVILRVYDLANTAYISTDTIPNPGLADGESDTVTIDLAGKTISNDLQLQIHCHTPGSGPSFSLSAKTLSSAAEFSNGLTVISALAEVPEIIKSFQEVVDLADSNVIQSAQLDGGSISLQIENATALSSDFQITLDDFTLSGSPLVISQTVAANSTSPVVVDLTGYIFAPVDQSAPQSLSFDVEVVIDSTSPSMVTIDQFDSLSVDATVSGLSFASMTGVIQETDATFDDIDVAIEIPKGFDEIQLSSATLTLEIENGVNFPGTLDLVILGDNGQSINLTGVIAAGSYGSPVLTVIEETDLASFLNPIPTNITVSGVASFGDGVTSGTVTPNDFVVSSVSINSPLEIIIGESSFEGDITEQTIDQTDMESITDHIIEASFISTIINHLPVGVTAEIYIDSDSTRLNATDAELVIGPLTIAPGTVAAGGTVVTAAVTSQNTITLDSLEIQILKNDTLYIGELITLMDTDGNPVRLSGNDYYTAQAVIQVEYLFDGEF